ncbi:MAG: D-glycero-beta-D-manno-heptose 1-phosphate adenylyltransferase [Pelagibacterales bacterium]|nr:D-glycero-beta-D-manno-heptose 1-phosphate adenylyltransferase [Pelagibacterales bacterium]
MSKKLNKLKAKIFNIKNLSQIINEWRLNGDKIVFTNGCFDLIHLGHLEILARSADLGDKLIVGINSDVSIKKIKGNSRPIIEEDSRAKQLAAIEFIDAVILFNEDTPYNLINILKPDVLTKGGDYKKNDIVGNQLINKEQGEVVIIPLTQGYSTTSILEKIKNE